MVQSRSERVVVLSQAEQEQALLKILQLLAFTRPSHGLVPPEVTAWGSAAIQLDKKDHGHCAFF
jgi:hypothetical protein